MGLLGVFEGEAAAEGRGADAETMVNRDWVGSPKKISVSFNRRSAATQVMNWVQQNELPIVDFQLREDQPKDWNQEWKNSFRGIVLSPHWEILPEHAQPQTEFSLIRINPGMGFGTGTHESTRLCLEWLSKLQPKRVLDFGSGSGILSIAAIIRGAEHVLGVEIDEHAIENAKYNCRVNQSQIPGVRSIEFQREFPTQQFDLVMANILMPVLVQYQSQICRAVEEHGQLILAGVLKENVPELQERYGKYFSSVEISTENEWASLLFRDRRSRIL